MGKECSTCACNDQKELDDSTVLNLQKKDMQLKSKYEENEYIKNIFNNNFIFKL